MLFYFVTLCTHFTWCSVLMSFWKMNTVNFLFIIFWRIWKVWRILIIKSTVGGYFMVYFNSWKEKWAFLLLVSTMPCCPICDKWVLNHSYSLKCCNSLQIYHMKCDALNADEHNCLLANKDTWICIKCDMGIFPFNSLRPSDAYMRRQNNRHWFR